MAGISSRFTVQLEKTGISLRSSISPRTGPSYVRESNVDYIYNAHKIAKNKGLRFYVLWDLYDIRWCDANPSDQAIGTDEVTPYVTGSGLKWVKLDRLITPGQVYHDYLIASVTYLFQNYSFDALCISEFYYKYTDFSAAMKVLWLAENPSYTDWPRNGDGSIDLYNTLLGEWKAAKLSSIVNEITGIAHTYGKKVYWMVRDNFSDADRMARETGQYWPIAKAACDGLWVWAYYNYQTGHRWERLANVVVKLRSLAETGKKHSISIGCWPSTDPLTVPKSTRGLDFLYQKAWTANDEGIEVTPYWLMTPGHFDVLWGSYNGYFNHEISRTQQQIIIITLDYCGRTFGTSPCLATGTPCYNTWGTCRYQSAYTNIGKEYKFSRNDRPLIAPGVRPYLKSYKELPTEIDPEKGLAINARVTLEFYDDENDTDVDVDPYLSQRSGIQGAFWKKLLARNKFYQRRQVIIKKGFQGMSEGDYQVGFKGVIDSISGPANGVVKIIIKDMLKKADAVDVPTATKGKTTDNPLTSSATVINLDSTAEYTASGWVRIDEEIIQYTGKSGNQITGCTRGGFSTTAAQHSQGATVQQCTVWQNQKPFDIINDILQNRVGIAALDIDITGAQADQDKWLPGYAFTGVISEPTKASELIAEICESSLAVIWWDNESQLIKFRVSTPAPPGTTVLSFNDVEHIIAGSTTVSRNEGKRASLVVVHFKKKAIGRDNEDGGYSAKVLEVDADKEGSNEYGERAIKKIYSRWIINDGEANHLASRTLSLFREPPIKLGFSVELKDDDLKTGDLFRLTTDDILDAAGTPEERLYQVLRKEPKEDNEIAFLVMDTRHSKRYGFIAPNGYPNYPSATAQQKEYAFVGNANNKVNGGIEDGYYIW